MGNTSSIKKILVQILDIQNTRLFYLKFPVNLVSKVLSIE